MDIVGTNVSETLQGTALNDRIWGLAGNDSLYGYFGADQLIGGSGADQLIGGFGRDTLGGASGNDTLQGGYDTDLLVGGFGADAMYGGYGSDALYGDYGNDFLRGFDGGYSQEIDTLTGGTGRDTFFIGDSTGVAYLGGSQPNTNTDVSYALIADFSAADDKVQAYGGMGNIYQIRYGSWSGSSDLDTGIYYNSDLLAVLQDTTAFSNQNFTFV